MRILYGVCGEGFGHSSRALSIAAFLEKQGHEVVIVTYGQAYKILRNRFKVFKVRGLHLIFKRGELQYKKTVYFNIKNFTKNLVRWKAFHKLMRDFKPELCISDMEVIVPVLSNWYKLPLISVDNQHRITNLDIKFPRKYYKDYLIARTVVSRIVSNADYYIVTSFSKTKILKKNTFIVSPVIRKEVLKLKPKIGEKILCYLTKKDSKILSVLKKIVNKKFVVYGYNINEKDRNLEFKKRETFFEDLKDCKAIIATAGFTLISEALYLKKPYLALPLKGQFEQTINALFLKQAGYGDYSENLTEHELKNFLENINIFRKKLNNYNSNNKELFVVLEKILTKIKNKES